MWCNFFLCTFSQAWQLTYSLALRPSENLGLHYGHPFLPIDSPSLNLHLPQIILHIFQPSQSGSSASSTSLWFSLRYFLNCLSWSILTMCPVHSNLFLISATMSRTLNSYLNSWLVLILHIPCSITGAYILLNILPSHVLILFKSILVIAHVSLPYTTTGFNRVSNVLILTAKHDS